MTPTGVPYQRDLTVYHFWYTLFTWRLPLALTKKVPAVFYQTTQGARPVRDFLMELPREDRRIIGEGIATVEYGWPIGKPTCAPIGFGRSGAVCPASVLPEYCSLFKRVRWC
jgi:hypothetical protein